MTAHHSTPETGPSYDPVLHAYSLLAQGVTPEQAAMQLADRGIPRSTSGPLIGKASGMLSDYRRQRVRTDLLLALALLMLGVAFTALFSWFALRSGRIVITGGLFIVGIAYSFRALAQHCGWRSAAELRLGQALAIRYESEAERDVRRLRVTGEARRAALERRVIWLFIVLAITATFAVLFAIP